MGSMSSLVHRSLLLHKLKTQRNVDCGHICLSWSIYEWRKPLLALVGRKWCEAWKENLFQGITYKSYFYLCFQACVILVFPHFLYGKPRKNSGKNYWFSWFLKRKFADKLIDFLSEELRLKRISYKRLY